MSAATRERLARILADEPVDLAEANLMISAEADPDADLDACRDALDDLAARAGGAGVVATLRDEGFRGALLDYDDPGNSFLPRIVERRRGLPIGLSTLALAVAARAGAPMAGIGLPGHFVIADLSGPEPAYIDPFHAWAAIDAGDCARLVAQTAGVTLEDGHLAPVSERAIVLRTLLNLRGSYMRRDRLEDALWTVDLLQMVAP